LAGLIDWEQAPALARIGKRVVEGVFQRRLLPERAAPVNNLMHPGATGSPGPGWECGDKVRGEDLGDHAR